jgi:predicted PurR-regulated permease PerM
MVWGTIWGVVGMFLCVPIMVVLLIVLSNFESTRPVAVLLSADGRLPSEHA